MKKTTAVVVLALLVFVFTTLVMANGPRISATDSSGWTSSATTTSTTLLVSATQSYTSTVASGSNAFAAATSGARIDVGAGASDYLSSDGTTISSAAPLSVVGSVASTTSQVYGTATTVPMDVIGSITAVAATSSIPAVRISPANVLGAADMVFQASTAAGAANLLSVDYSGDVVGGSFTATNGRFFSRNAQSGFSFGSAGTQYFGMNAGASTMTLGNSAIFDIASGALIKFNGLLLWSSAAPTITSACTTPTVTHGAVPSFQVDVGGTCTGVTTIVMALPTATNGWECHGYNKTTNTVTIEQTADTTASATLVNTSKTTGLAVDFVDGADLVISCIGR